MTTSQLAPTLRGLNWVWDSNAMRIEINILTGDQTLTEDIQIQGMVIGSCFVPSGVYLRLHGIVSGDLRVEEGGTADVYGTVSGTLYGDGTINVYGIVGKVEGTQAIIHPRAIVAGTER